MNQKLVKHGDELALVVDPALLVRLGINESSAFEVSVEQGVLQFRPVPREGVSEERLAELHDSISQRYAKTFRRLADES